MTNERCRQRVVFLRRFYDLPAEKFLDLLQTNVVNNFAWSAATYPNSTNPNLDGKPVFVLALKSDEGGTTTVSYSFASLAGLIVNYTARDASIVIPAGGTSFGVNISSGVENLLELKNDGLFVRHDDKKMDTVSGAVVFCIRECVAVDYK